MTLGLGLGWVITVRFTSSGGVIVVKEHISGARVYIYVFLVDLF